MESKRFLGILPLLLIYGLFFLLGFIWNLFNIQTLLGAALSFLPFFLMSYPVKIIINHIDTQNAIAIGIIITGMGLLIFYPAATVQNYDGFLSGLFVLFSGITLLQSAYNPYIGFSGKTETCEVHVNFFQSISAIGATLTASIEGWFMLEKLYIMINKKNKYYA